jgi:hypothetical protein
MRPITASAALRQFSPRKLYTSAAFPALRNNSVRDESPMRQRSGSVKRKSDDSASYAAAASSHLNVCAPVFSREKFDQLTLDISKVNSICDKVEKNISNVEDKTVRTILSDLNEAMKLINGNHT